MHAGAFLANHRNVVLVGGTGAGKTHLAIAITANVVRAILRGHGRRVGRCRIERLMRRAGLRGLAALPRRTRTTDSRHGYLIAPNRLGRNFTAQAPNQIWLADHSR